MDKTEIIQEIEKLVTRWKDKPVPPRASTEWFKYMGDRMKYRLFRQDIFLLEKKENQKTATSKIAEEIFNGTKD